LPVEYTGMYLLRQSSTGTTPLVVRPFVTKVLLVLSPSRLQVRGGSTGSTSGTTGAGATTVLSSCSGSLLLPALV
jgi:hypothetical protein